MICENLSDKAPVTKRGYTPLHLAAKQGYGKICQFFLDQGVDSLVKTAYGDTAFDFAIRNGRDDIAAMLAWLPTTETL